MSNTQYNPGGPPWPPQGNDPSYIPPPHYQQQHYQQQQQGSYPYAQQPQPIYYQPVVVPANNDNSTVTLVLGILSIVFSGPIGLILGIVGLTLANKARRQFPIQNGTITAGRVCSIIGIVLSSFAFVFILLYVIVIFFAIIASARPGY
jgi:hypothetical protein